MLRSDLLNIGHTVTRLKVAGRLSAGAQLELTCSIEVQESLLSLDLLG